MVDIAEESRRLAEELREADANTRDFTRRNSSRERQIAVQEESSIAARLERAEAALRWAGYRETDDGSWGAEDEDATG